MIGRFTTEEGDFYADPEGEMCLYADYQKLESKLDIYRQQAPITDRKLAELVSENTILASRLDSARRYCEEVIAREPEHLDVWRRACASVAANVLNELNGTVKHPVVERRDSIETDQSGPCGAMFSFSPDYRCKLPNDHEGCHEMIFVGQPEVKS